MDRARKVYEDARSMARLEMPVLRRVLRKLRKKSMGLCIEADENEQGVDVEIRRESVRLGPTKQHGEDKFFCVEGSHYGWEVEVDKEYLKKLISFFNENPKHLEE